MNDISKLSKALHSRLQPIDFTHTHANTEVMERMHVRAKDILTAEGVQMEDEVLRTIIRESYPDMRAVLKRLEVESIISS
ncbi:hypothetical protein [Novimethylophilus kurashikiensis]|uniref:hypothetical protein n=1 Tax=Novimethylophilus kurashikiensis TaxID=1825523 RepID=UPI0011B213D6|nr:hypothetical protein [Novimethylophilus kurashikiensis]